MESTAEPAEIPDRWRYFAFRSYLALQRVDTALLEPHLPPRDLLQPGLLGAQAGLALGLRFGVPLAPNAVTGARTWAWRSEREDGSRRSVGLVVALGAGFEPEMVALAMSGAQRPRSGRLMAYGDAHSPIGLRATG